MLLVVATAAFVAGLIQTLTGFGAGVIMVFVLSNYLGMIAAPAINTSICLGLTTVLSIKYWKSIELRRMAAPIVTYTILSAISIYFVTSINIHALAVAFGIFLVCISVFSLFFSNRIRIREKKAVLLAFSMISGVFSGLFGVGGPLLAVYLVSTTEKQESYIANTQFLFTATNIINMGLRIIRGIYIPAYIGYSAIGLSAILLGMFLGIRVRERINVALLKKVVYLFVLLSGIATIVQHAAL